MGRIFECLPLFDLDNIQRESEEILDLDSLAENLTAHGFFAALQQQKETGLSTLMDGLQLHLSSAEILSRYQLNVPLRWYLQSINKYDMQKQLCLRLATQVVGSVENNGSRFMSDDSWTALLVDMMDLYNDGNGVLGALSQEEIFEIYWKALLRCGSKYIQASWVIVCLQVLTINVCQNSSLLKNLYFPSTVIRCSVLRKHKNS
jgi:hypothetical protein